MRGRYTEEQIIFEGTPGRFDGVSIPRLARNRLSRGGNAQFHHDDYAIFTNRAPLRDQVKKTLKHLPYLEGVEFALRYQEPSSIGCFNSYWPNVSAGDTSPIMYQNNSFKIYNLYQLLSELPVLEALIRVRFCKKQNSGRRLPLFLYPV